MLAGLQMNTVALGLLQLSAVASCRHFRGRQEEREPLAFGDQLKTHIQIEGAQQRVLTMLHPYRFALLPGLSQLFSNLINNIKTEKKDGEPVSSLVDQTLPESSENSQLHLFPSNPLLSCSRYSGTIYQRCSTDCINKTICIIVVIKSELCHRS